MNLHPIIQDAFAKLKSILSSVHKHVFFFFLKALAFTCSSFKGVTAMLKTVTSLSLKKKMSANNTYVYNHTGTSLKSFATSLNPDFPLFSPQF